MKILITGGAGFIGSHVADAYIAAGHQLWILDDLSTGKRENIPPTAQFIQADLAEASTSDVLGLLLTEEKIDAVNHHAAQMDVRRSVADPLFDARVNVVGLIRVLEACRKAACKRFIFSSSGGTVYGEQKAFPASEEHPTAPISPYGVSKLAGEGYLQFYRFQYGLETVILRYANVYGPRQDPHGEAGVVSIFSKLLLAGEPITINGDGEQTRDYVFVEDVARANLNALACEATGPINIGTGRETSVNVLAGLVRDITGSVAPVRYAERKPGEQKRSVLACERAESVLNWRSEFTITEGLAKTVASLRG